MVGREDADAVVSIDAQTAALFDEPTTLYRFFDARGQLLYVGITSDLPTRLRTHNRLQNWWRDVVRTTLEHFESREAARAAELRAIRDELPRYNRWSGVQHQRMPAEVAAAIRAIAEQDRRDWRAGECARNCADGCPMRIDALAVEDRLRLDPEQIDCTLLDLARETEARGSR
jgi:predicted GIY-YIG superfamily endonuclease